MWVFTKYVFFSAVCQHEFVRSRDRRHLENWKAKFNLDDAIRTNKGTDYA